MWAVVPIFTLRFQKTIVIVRCRIPSQIYHFVLISLYIEHNVFRSLSEFLVPIVFWVYLRKKINLNHLYTRAEFALPHTQQ